MNIGEVGMPYPSAQAGPIDVWSETFYAVLRNCRLTAAGEWTRWEPGYLLLTVARVNESDVNPVYFDSADGEFTVSFGRWETHNPAPDEPWDASVEVIAPHAILLAERWLCGELRTAFVTDAVGKWCGSSLIEPGDFMAQLKEIAQNLRAFSPKHIEVRTGTKREFDLYVVEPEWMLPPAVSGSVGSMLPRSGNL